MRSPADMEFIQIDITNACNMRCSNCTRFCGNHEKVFFMDYDTFTRAVDSLDGFDGVVGLIGGEPTLHPEFERIAGYMKEKFGKPSGGDAMLYPQSDFIHGIHAREFDAERVKTRPDGGCYMKKHGAGLWSNMSASFRRYYETIQDCFSVEYLNDHINPSYHQPGLFARKDLNIPDDEWYELRDKCWIQNTWSATVTPKGAFFCEVAGALDMLFDGPGGWKIEKGWWKRTPDDFADQLHWCEICGFALEGRTFTRDSQEETDDVSPTVYEMLSKTNSPKLKSGHINPVKITNGVIDRESIPEDKRFVVGDRYISRYEDRFQEENSILFDMDVAEIVKDEGDAGALLTEAVYSGRGPGKAGHTDRWLLVKDSEGTDVSELKSMIGKRVFNPGSLITGDGYLFFCCGALSIRKMGYDTIAHMKTVDEFVDSWQKEKVIKLSDTADKTGLKRKSLEAGKRYAIWGAGVLGETFIQMAELSGAKVTVLVDRAAHKKGSELVGYPIVDPDILRTKADDYDKLIIAHHLKFEEIKEDAVRMGILPEKIMLPFEV